MTDSTDQPEPPEQPIPSMPATPSTSTVESTGDAPVITATATEVATSTATSAVPAPAPPRRSKGQITTTVPPLLPWWPPVRTPVPPPVYRAVFASGLAGAIALPWGRSGPGWLLVTMVMGVGVLAVARKIPTHGPTVPIPPVRVGWAVAAVVLIGAGVVRAADWLFVLCVLAACAAGSVAVTGGRSGRALLFGVIAVPAAALRCPPWLVRGLPARLRVGVGGARIAGSVLVGVVLVAVFGALFSGADAAFDRLLSHVVPSVDGESVFRWVFLFTVAGAGTGGACYLLVAPVPLDDPRGGKPLRRIEWTLPVGALVALFAAFVAVQAAALFGGDAYVSRTAGLTFAQYARSGFWQLLWVSVLTLVVIAAVVRWAPASTPLDRAWLRGLLGALALLTLVIVASALTRMWAYQQAYGFTVLRLFVEVCELWLGLVYLLVIIAGARARGAWLPTTVVASAVVAVLALAVMNPDRFVAEHNIARWQQTGNIDLQYLSTLSADAVPALNRLPEPLRSCALSDLADRLNNDRDDWRTWNLSRSAARRTVGELPHPSIEECSAARPR